MLFKFLFALLALIVLEVINLFKNGIMEHKLAYGILKVIILNTLLISVLALKSFYLNLLIKIKEAVPPIIETAVKIISTPIKTPKKINLNNN